ncbi:siderophore-interacting protein [Nocardioides sp. Bht2]|uniref:siderophore-interacting protein n=1 Tax=Nocardioides sp. Bht2 TaxID=3392297 RepID=UPI0039B5CAD5
MAPEPQMIIDVASVRAVTQLSPNYTRVELTGPSFAELGVAGPWLDQRIKIVFPSTDGLPPTTHDGPDLWSYWRSLPESERGHMRTYSVRDVVGDGDQRTLVVDMVRHDAPGLSGPGGRWATTAAVGDQVIVVAPRRGAEFGGIEFAPTPGQPLLLVADETAVPAASRILADLPDDAEGHAFFEVPHPEDFLDLERPDGVTVHWLARGDADWGTRLVPEVLYHLGHTGAVLTATDDEVDPNLWEVPAAPEAAPSEHYAWIAGESGVVTTLRRYLVRDLELPRSQVAFMGYWRKGVTMA